jgi:NAD(P)-dependent dehydrogenase (short-subunit alcohol dehydrogenase family)
LKRLEGKVVMVTGSGRGFGRSMALAYGLEGATVICVARTLSELNGTRDMIRASGGNAVVFNVDLAVPEEIDSLGETVVKRFGGLDVLVNNAATSPWKTLEETTLEDWDRVLGVNLRAPFLLAKTFKDSMVTRGGGSIINITSKSAEVGFVAEIGYCPSKYGLEGLTQCLALELRPSGIAVNSLNVSAPEGRRLKPTELTLREASEMPEDEQSKIASEEEMVDAFKDAWTFLALQRGDGVTGRRLTTKGLLEDLEKDGWEAVEERLRGKLTIAVYQPYDFPRKVRYQTPEGGWDELVFEP